jgi:cyclohexanecarboxyl-CoA dehydrogenase
MTEPEVGSDAAHIRCRAVKDGEYYTCNGEKTPISYTGQADYANIFMVTDPEKGARGVTAFIVPYKAPGIAISVIPHFGATGMGCSSCIFDNYKLHESYRCGEEGTGFIWGMTEFDWMRSGLALQDAGMAAISLEETIEYVKTRYAFGRPIGKYEGISFKIADNLAQVEAGRLLAYKALWLTDQGRHREATVENAMAKYFLPRASFRAIWDCILAHGHVGYSSEYPLGRRLVDSISWMIGDGTREVMETIIVRDMIGKDMVAYK